MGKKKSRQDDDYWTSGFEDDMNSLAVDDTQLTVDKITVDKVQKPVVEKKSNAKPTKTTKEEITVVTTEESAKTTEQTMAASQSSANKASRKNAHVDALRQMLARKQALEEEQRKLEEEEQLKLQKQQEQEELAKQEHLKRLQKRQEKEALDRQELKKQGLLLTKSQREKVERDRIKLEQLKSLGLVRLPEKEALPENTSQQVKEKSKKPVYGKKKKQPKTENQSAMQNKSMQAEKEEAVPENWEDDIEDEFEKEKEKDEKSSVISTVSTSKNLMNENHEEILPKPLADSVSNSGILSEKSSEEGEQKSKNEDLRSPICCILGHVDTGKTKLLDKIRQTNVQEGEAGGITQQIGATYFPIEIIKEKTVDLNESKKLEYNVPGLLIIDTPGHESFTNLRSRGSSLCNIAILVVDITAGLEAQTLESLRLLKQRKTPFVVALNKVDRLYGWQAYADKPIQYSLKNQKDFVINEYEERVKKSLLALTEQGLNVELYYKNKDFRKYVSVVPTSAITGEGIPDLLMLIVQLTQKLMASHLRYQSENFECTVLEVKVIEGLGTTIDCVLSNGILREGDRITVCGLNGPIYTTIRAILTPQPMREMRIKGQYIHHKMVKAALGVKICAPDLEKAVAGSKIVLIPHGTSPEDEVELYGSEVMSDLNSMLDSTINRKECGVFVQASTLGSLEALLQFLFDSQIPVSGINIGPVHKKDVVRASTMLERAPEYAMILAFDVKVEKEAHDLAEEMGIKIFTADIIYHLFDQFTAYMKNIQEERKRSLASQAVFPCILKIVPGCVFNTRDPIILGVSVTEGTLRIGTPVCVVNSSESADKSGVTLIGKVTSIEQNHKAIPLVKKGGPSVAIKISHEPWDTPKMVGRHFGEKDEILSRITRQSIDVLKEHFRNDMEKDDWQLIVKLKKMLSIQ